MRTIHITESQLKYCLGKIYEDTGDGVTVAANTDNSGKVTTDTLKQQANTLQQQGINSKIAVDQSQVTENYKVYTKKNLKEARLSKLVKESKRYTKKNFLRK